MTFTEFVHKCRYTAFEDFPHGLFLYEARHDPDLPDAASWGELRDYLKKVGACDAAIEGAALVWRAYAASPLRAYKSPDFPYLAQKTNKGRRGGQ